MARVTIVSGCPGTGKTTLGQALAASSPRGVLVDSDLFYRFFTRPILPVLAEARDQNGAAIRAVAASARAFALSGYEVVVDGVVGPWFIPVFLREVDAPGIEVEYIVLRAPLAETLGRAMSRSKAIPEHDQIVRHMHAQFADIGDLEPHVVDTANQTSTDTLKIVSERRLSRRFVLSKRSTAS
ncbi:MAG TPA: AAA family ATPase [Candidatus Binatia bacterium]|nr:AAA family ATPase [Candidatus Binatia bacterium]